MVKSIITQNISKKYQLYSNTKERLLDLISPKSYGEGFYALKDISFEADKGDIIGFVGINGSGKSTLSNILAGIVPETSGTVTVNGETALISVAAGLKGDLTGRDNIELKCLMLGFTKEEIKNMESDIIEFSELGHFIDQPVKSYSSGMKSRLGFAISVNVNPDILIIDEALSVGDKAFAEKSLDKMNEFKKLGKTMIFVSHSIGQMKKFCEKILWLEFGKVKRYGTVDEVMPKYEMFLKEWKKMSKEEREIYRNYSLLGDEKSLNSIINLNSMENDEDENNIYTENQITRIGHIKKNSTYIYSTPKSELNTTSTDDFLHSAYFIKKEATFNNELYYLLSQKPSAVTGVIGWIKASETTSHLHLFIDNDLKQFIIKGSGVSYTRPWGGRNNIVYKKLADYKNLDFFVKRTEKVGNNFWYYGELLDKNMWIHSSHLKQV